MTPAEQYAEQRSHAVALIEAHAPQLLQGSLIDLLRPAIALDVERCAAAAIAISASKFGGAPDVANGFEWPQWNVNPSSDYWKLPDCRTRPERRLAAATI